jgi:glyoxylase I family protein
MAALQHLGINCIDPVRQERFYTKHFGFRRARVFNPGQANQVPMVRLGGMCLEFFPTAPNAASQRGGEQIVGFKHLAFEVDDIERKVRDLQADGVETGAIMDCSGLVPGLRICFFKDPEGNILEIMEGWKDEGNPPLLS